MQSLQVYLPCKCKQREGGGEQNKKNIIREFSRKFVRENYGQQGFSWRKEGRKENMEKICGYEIKAERQSKGLRGNANYFRVIVEYGRSTRKSTKGEREGNFHSRSRIQGLE